MALAKFNKNGEDSFNDKATFTPSEILKNLKIYMGDSILMWFLPIPPFHGKSDEELYAEDKRKLVFS